MSDDDDNENWDFDVSEQEIKDVEKRFQKRARKAEQAENVIARAKAKNISLDGERVERKSRSDAEAYIGSSRDLLAEVPEIGDRVVSLGVDLAFLFVLSIVGKKASVSLFPQIWKFCDEQLGDVSFLQDEPRAMMVIGYIITIILAGFIFSFMGAILKRSPGKIVTKCIVEDMEGGDATFFQALMRETVGKFVSIITVVGLLMVLFTKERRGLHDYMFKTTVRKR